jgi:hypothetical protein
MTSKEIYRHIAAATDEDDSQSFWYSGQHFGELILSALELFDEEAKQNVIDGILEAINTDIS